MNVESRNETSHLAPAAIEDAVQRAFHLVLDNDSGADDAFQSLGGTSMQGILICAHISREVNATVPVSLLLENPTISRLSAAISRLLEPVQKVALSGGFEPNTLALSDGQAGFLFRWQLDPEDTTTSCPLIWVLSHRADVSALTRAVADVHHHHPELGASYCVDDAGPVARFDRPSPAPQPKYLSASTVSEALEKTSRTLASSHLNPDAGENWNWVISEVLSGETVLGFSFSHITFDGYSESVFARHLSLAYHARLKTGVATELPKRPTVGEIATLRVRPRVSDTERALQDRVALKLERISDLRFPLPDITSHARPGAGGHASATFSRSEAKAIEGTARSSASSVFAVLITLYARALEGALSQADFGIAFPVMQRADAAMLETIGCFVETACIAASDILGECPGDRLENAIDRAASAVSEALDETEVTYSKMISISHRKRGSMSPVCQTMFTYHNTPPAVLVLGEDKVSVTRLREERHTLELTAEVRPLPDGRMLLEAVWDPAVVREDIGHRVTELFSNAISDLARHSASIDPAVR